MLADGDLLVVNGDLLVVNGGLLVVDGDYSHCCLCFSAAFMVE